MSAVAGDDLGVSKALICEAEFDASFFFWGEKKLFTFLISSGCFFPFTWSVIADRKLDESSKFFDKQHRELLFCLYYRNQSLNTGSSGAE